MVATVVNKTGAPVSYRINYAGAWIKYTLQPGYQVTYSQLNRELLLTYSYNSQEEKTYALQVTPIVGHSPTKSEQEKARVNYFELGSDGNIHFFAQDETDILTAARAAQAKAESEARDARTAQAAAERAAAQKKDVWFVAKIINRTKTKVSYAIQDGEGWSNYDLPPNSIMVHTMLNKYIVAKYKYNLQEERVHSLQASVIVEREPTELEKTNAAASYFEVGRDGNLYLYSQTSQQTVRSDIISAADRELLGFVALSQNDLAGAYNSFTEAIRLNPESLGAHYGLGITHLKLGNKDLAHKEYERIKKINPNDLLTIQLYQAISRAK